ncbi:MAG: hypothetical protein P4L74_05735 [Candidatus Doudnabacteria bacterium]|nr:hypothetical protein [Candidatus Doudnabacteria bacterium]
MNNKTEGQSAILAALLVLFSAMLSPAVSTTIAFAALAGFGIYHLTKK